MTKLFTLSAWNYEDYFLFLKEILVVVCGNSNDVVYVKLDYKKVNNEIIRLLNN